MPDKNLTRKHLAKTIYKNLGFSKNLSLKIVDNFFNILTSELLKSKKVKISSFGTFGIFNKNERIGRNPKTKIEVKISSRRVVRFKPSLLIKEKINKKNESK
tara:strand:- start:825 stop:1130 length:306 start_codon:yes stop_codon:yes gene_type:complete